MNRTLGYVVNWTVVLAIIWLLFSGMWDHPIIMPLGAASVALTVYLAYRLGIMDSEGDPMHLIIPSLKYWPWLMGQIIRANLQVAGCILRGNQTLSPRMARLRSQQTTDLGRAIMANSITLTPGTVAVQVRAGEIDYYAMNASLVAELDEGEMNRRVAKLEQEL